MILIPVACAALSVVSGCGSGAPSALTSGSQPSAGYSAGYSATSPVAPSAAADPAPDGSPASNSPASGSAILNMRDGQGDSYTQTFSFGSPEPESGVPDAINGMQTCELGVAIPARNLVIPVQITTTLTTSVQTQIQIGMDIAQYGSDDSNAGLPGDIVYQTTSGDLCETDQPGAEVTLSQGQSATTQAWIVLQNAITPAYPDGDLAQLGVNFIYFGYTGSNPVTSAQGTAVCTGDPQTQQTYSPPFLVFAGNAPSGEGCDGTYTAQPG